ncbi:MAG: DsrE family protein [Phycisphaerae bacterium]|nr:DsrE family protein [Phycisphaerae bacterium]
MNKVAIFVFADTEGMGEIGRAVNALITAREFKEAGDEVKIIFDGAGTKWIGTFADPGHKYHSLWTTVRDCVTGACEYCANAFGVTEAVQAAGISLSADYDGHPSFRQLVSDGWQVLTF